MASAPVRSRRFFGPVVLVGGVVTLVYTVPAGRTAIFHAVLFANTGVIALNAQLRVNATTAAGTIFTGALPGVASVDLPDRVILNPGDVLYAVCLGGAGGNVSGFGSLLDGAPT